MSLWDRHGREGVPQSGTFSIGNQEGIFGSLTLNRRNSTLDLRGEKFFHSGYFTEGYTYVHGTLHDLTKVSLMKCAMLEGLGQTIRGQESFNHAKFAPSYALFGDVHLRPEDQSVVEVSFFVDDASALYYDFGVFGSVLEPKKYIDLIAAANTQFDPKIPTHQTGPDPAILYFTGKREICATDTVLGTVTATHNTRRFLPRVDGVKIESAVCVTVTFPEPKTFDHSIATVMTLLRFLELCIGRPQKLERLFLFLPEKDGAPVVLDVYWTLRPWRETDDTDVEPAGVLLDPVRGTAEYSAVLAGWLQRDAEWQDARFRFSTCFKGQRTYSIDRLVGAANMFDILPASAVPADVDLPEDLAAAREKAQNDFAKLVLTYERDQVLGALGRLGKPALKHKVRRRAQMILDKLEEGHVPGLIKVCDAAVDCRNFYVHGYTAKIDYNKHFNLLVFLTETLEFVFGASDLVEAGWDFKRWYDGVRGTAHPFSEYLRNYPRSLQMLIDLKGV